MTPSPVVRACATAYAHIDTVTLRDATPAEVRACFDDSAVRQLEARLQAATLMGDLIGTQAILQALNRAYKAALARVRAEVTV